jgi:hypothetical protein
VPLLPAALVSSLAWRFGRGPILAGLLGGAVFGAVCQIVWPSFGVSGGVLLGAPFAAVGMALGGRLGGLLTQPTARRSVALALVSLLAPFASGAVDLVLRLSTPWG